MQKPSLRHQFIDLRKNLSSAYRVSADTSIFEKLVVHPLVAHATTICCYVSHKDEVDTHAFIRWCLGKGKTVVIPKVSGKTLTLHAVDSLESCVPAFKGILEPPENTLEVLPASVDLFVVIGIAFDAFRYRLGYGAGFTDRLLADVAAPSIGVCYTDQLVYQLPKEKHDIPQTVIITDTVAIQ